MKSFPADAHDFFPEARLPLPFEGETLYGWCARFHRLSCNVVPSVTSRQLFGHATAGLRHDFPRHLDHFHAVTRGLLGPITDVIHQRTQFPYFAAFLDDEQKRAVVEGMRGRGGKSISQRLGLTRSGLSPVAPLKACRECLYEDLTTAFTGWWHREHQWDSAKVCLRHRELLAIASDRLHSGRVKDWHLPQDLTADQWHSLPSIDSTQLDRLVKITRWTRALLDHRDATYDSAPLRYSYLLQAKARNWVAMDGTLRLIALRDSFSKAHQGLEFQPGMYFLKEVSDVNAGFLGLLLRGYPGLRHPIKHIILMSFLFEEPEEFFARYRLVKAIADVDGIDGVKKMLTDIRKQLRKMVESDNRSVNSTCLELGLPPAQAIRYLNKEGVAYQKRPRVLNPYIEERLIQLLRTGSDRATIAAMLGIRVAFVRDYLTKHPELRTAWEAAFAAKRRSEYRDHFLRVLQENPSVPIKRIRRIPCNGFEWLYRNDRDWLAGQLPAIWRR